MTIKERLRKHYVYECCFCRSTKRIKIFEKESHREGSSKLSDYGYACNSCLTMLYTNPGELIARSKYWNEKPRLKAENYNVKRKKRRKRK